MILYLANGPNSKEEFYSAYLYSYHYVKNSPTLFRECLSRKKKKTLKNLFLDSGAYSALAQGKVMDLDSYIEFIKKYQKSFTIYANLDDIKCPKITLENQKYMESNGLEPLPCYHYGEDPKHLIKYLDNYEYIAIGGTVSVSGSKLTYWFDEIFDKYLCDDKGKPRVKIHGFGMTNFNLMSMYPWYSVDSVSWRITAAMSSIYVPYPKKGKPDFLRTPHVISMGHHKSVKWYSLLSPMLKKYIESYVNDIGYSIEQVKEYKYRSLVNIYFFEQFNKQLKNKTFKRNKPASFGL